MPLKRSSNYPAIILAASIAILFVGGAAMFGAHLILAGDWSDFLARLALLWGPLASSFFYFCLVLQKAERESPGD